MNKSTLVLSIAVTASLTSFTAASETPITGTVASKCSIFTETTGVYGNPTPDKLSTASADGGVVPVIRYDVATASAYKAKISWPTSFSTSPTLTDSLAWDGEATVGSVSDAGMSAYEAAKVEYNNTTEFDLTIAGSTWFNVTSSVLYGQGKALPGGTYTAMVVAECIAQ